MVVTWGIWALRFNEFWSIGDLAGQVKCQKSAKKKNTKVKRGGYWQWRSQGEQGARASPPPHCMSGAQ